MSALIFALSLFAAQAETAAGPPPAATAEAEAEKKGGNSEERFCRNEAPMGTRIPKVRCYVKQEFERRQLEERQNLERIQNDARAPTSR